MRRAGERNNRKAIRMEKRKVTGKIVLTCIVVCIVTYGAARAVTGDEKKECLSAEQYAVLEEESVRELKQVLRSYYLSNAGVMLTKTGGTGKQCQYQIQIHHKGLARLDAWQQEMINGEIHKSVEQIWGTPLIMTVNAEDEETVSCLLSLME
ncbi:MAG: hypothetical protein QM697_16835 [Lachnospiraceae bacterium]